MLRPPAPPMPTHGRDLNGTSGSILIAYCIDIAPAELDGLSDEVLRATDRHCAAKVIAKSDMRVEVPPCPEWLLGWLISEKLDEEGNVL